MPEEQVRQIAQTPDAISRLISSLTRLEDVVEKRIQTATVPAEDFIKLQDDYNRLRSVSSKVMERIEPIIERLNKAIGE